MTQLREASTAAGARLVLWIAAIAPLVLGLIVMSQHSPAFAKKVSLVDRPVHAFTQFDGASVTCRYAVFVPADAVRCSEGQFVALSDLDRGEVVKRDQVLSVDGKSAVVEVPAATSPPAGGERCWIVGRSPAPKSDDAATDVMADGVALGTRGDKIVVALAEGDVMRLAPALTASPPTVVAVRAVGPPRP